MSLLPDRAARAFPLLLLGLLAGLALLLDRATELPYFSPVAANRDPDLIISRFAATGFGNDGKPLYTLTAREMRHFPADERLEFSQARLVRTLPSEPTLTVDASTARVTDDGDKIWFERDVVMHREAAGQTGPLVLHTSRLSLDTARGQAASDAPTQLDSPGYQANAVGFDYDNNSTQLNLRSKVNIRYAPPKR
ncbi:LPS export ABC transporter periplasmic protein LptC [Chitinimonas koreensis]|uniref:LPS export ABC transporter periplasmic protein LptC n=1 Tax=Chitinimonas koreensis TaxID=356302 RepID=UPI00041B8A1B|nr:LPS export ABC transporter periplasmic protein LptC [Chitinimonas koreensis]QNM97150.1 LPS export ABC transporter periplasmic protein LptC [Chitinimonas koreensis]